ncbi:MAG: methylated-DNA--[protein]-cysteine S-methyltransferase [Methanothrix sp.]
MTPGAPVPSLGLYILVEQSGFIVKRIFFSRESPSEISPLAEQIVLHLEKGTACPKADLDLSGCTAFQRIIYALVRTIPRGGMMTYGQVAELAGRPGAARAVGQAMASNPFAVLVPCHRVVSRSGPGGYAYGRDIKEKLLLLERQVP